MRYEKSHEEKVEEARARLKTAYDRMMATPINSPSLQPRIEIHNSRKRELAALLISKHLERYEAS